MLGDARNADRVPIIPPHLIEQLQAVEPSVSRSCEFRPCQVRLADGQWRDRVYLVEAIAFLEYSGIWPWEMPEGEGDLSISEIFQIEDSPTRLPPSIATKIWAGGETGMGYYAFTLCTLDGRKIPCIGDPDWVQLPPGVTAGQITDVLPHAGRNEATNAPIRDIAWCLYRWPT
jgi:hypothetical protein